MQKQKKPGLQWFHDQGIERIALGDIILRCRTSEHHWVCSASVTKSLLESPAGEQLARLFEAQDFLAGLPDNEALLETVLIPLDMEIQSREDERSLQAVTTKGFNFQAGLSPFTAEVIRGLDGRTSLRDAIRKSRSGRGRRSHLAH